MKAFQSEPNEKEAARKEVDVEPLRNESGDYSVHDLESSSAVTLLSPSSSHNLLSDTDDTTDKSEAMLPLSDMQNTSTPGLQFSKENGLQNSVLIEEPEEYQNDASHSTEGKAYNEEDVDDDDVPYSMI